MRNGRIGVVIGIYLLFGLFLTNGSRAQGPPTPAPIRGLAGIEEGVARSFVRVGRAENGTAYLASQVILLDPVVLEATRSASADLAAGAFGRSVGEGTVRALGLTAPLRAGEFRPVSVSQYKDATYAWVATSPDEPVDTALVSVAWGNYVYAYAASGRLAEPLDDLMTVIASQFDPLPKVRAPAPTADYRTEGIWRRLPRLEHLPPGFVFDREWVAVRTENETVLATPVSTP